MIRIIKKDEITINYHEQENDYINVSISLGIGLSYTWDRVFIGDTHVYNVYTIIIGVFRIKIGKKK